MKEFRKKTIYPSMMNMQKFCPISHRGGNVFNNMTGRVRELFRQTILCLRLENKVNGHNFYYFDTKETYKTVL